MTITAGRPRAPLPEAASVEACCAVLYGDPAIHRLLGDSLHPGGLAATGVLLSAAGLRPGGALLDLGCGTGASSWFASSRLPGVAITGLDPSETALATARARSHPSGTEVSPARGAASAPAQGIAPSFVRGSAAELPFEDGTFDAVLAECVLSTVDKPRALSEIHRVLAPGGRLLLSDMTVGHADALEGQPAHPLLAAALCLSGAWMPGEIERSLAAHGFDAGRPRDGAAELRAMLDVIAARIDLLRLVARDLGPLLGSAPSLVDGATWDDAVAVLAWGRRAAATGGIGYVSLVATAR